MESLKLNIAKELVNKYNSTSLILRILCGIIAGVILAVIIPKALWICGFGVLFVGALKAIAPVLVFALVTSAFLQGGRTLDKRFGMIIFFYLMSTLLAAFTAVSLSFLFPQTLSLAGTGIEQTAPAGITEVLKNLLMNMIINPIESIRSANYIGVLFWAVIFGLALKECASNSTKEMFINISDAVSIAVRWVINLAPFGIMGLVFDSVAHNGLEIFTNYGQLILMLVGCMLFVMLISNPLIVACVIRTNPYPLVFKCIKESGITAFFTRSSAANIPVNMTLCEKLGLDKDMYSVSIPLGATINMNGAAVTIIVMTLAAAHTLGISVDLPTAIILSTLATLGACGASGVAGGSLLLIPMACSLFGISNDFAMQVVSVGFIIGIIQDSMETALNSSSDVIFVATTEYYQLRKQGKPLPDFMLNRS